MNNPLLLFFFLFFFMRPSSSSSSSASTNPTNHVNTCRSYCGNLTVDYPFSTKSGCGHPGFRELLFCVNDVLMLHISSGSYRVLQIDYAFHSITLHEPFMSTCHSIFRSGSKPNGLVLEPSRAPFLTPAPENVFLLLGCSAQSPLFQGFPTKHLPCRNVSSMGCEEFYSCPAWNNAGGGAAPPRCCSVSYEAIRAINLTKLECEGYSSAYNVAPLKVAGPSEWSYGIRMTYSVPGDFAFCRACEATRGTCGYDEVSVQDLCLCGSWNSTTNCDSVSSSEQLKLQTAMALAGVLTSMVLWIYNHHLVI